MLAGALSLSRRKSNRAKIELPRIPFTEYSGDSVIVDPQNTQIVLGRANLPVKPGYIKSASTQDGHELWRVALPKENGFNQFPDSRARFTPDGATVYMVTATATGDNNTSRSFVYAVDAKVDAAAEILTITGAQYNTARPLLQVKATDSNVGATLQVYVTSTNTLIGTPPECHRIRREILLADKPGKHHREKQPRRKCNC